MKAKALQVVAKILECTIRELDENSALGVTPHWDSLSHVNILLYLEENFNIEINEQTLDKYRHMSAIIELIDEK